MAFFRFNDPGYFDAITSKELKFSQELAREAGYDVGAVLLGAEGDMDAPMVSILQLEPGGVLPRHAHDCYRVEVVLRGSIDNGETILGPGDTMISAPGEWYGPHIAGPEGSTTVEIFSKALADIEYAPVDDPEKAALYARASRNFGTK